jgi:hypothetical protein
MTFDKEIIPKYTASQMESNFNKAAELVRDGYKTLAEAQKLLNDTFGRYTHYGDLDVYKSDDRWVVNESTPDNIIRKLRRSAWYIVLNELEISKVLSKKRYDETMEKLKNDEMPDFTAINIFDIFNLFMSNQDVIYKELIQEALKTLYPDDAWRHTYVTNHRMKAGLGRKVIIAWTVEHSWSGGKFRVRSYSDQKLIVVDRVFHLLDGKGIPDGYKSELVDAINTSPNGFGETEYFKFRACANMNLHLEMKRTDLLHKMLQIANGNQIYEPVK